MIGGSNFGPGNSGNGGNHKMLSNTGGYHGGIMTQGQAMHGSNNMIGGQQ